MTITGREVPDELFERVLNYFSEDEIIELTEIIAWENASAKFNRALRIPSQKLWQPAARLFDGNMPGVDPDVD
jgi:alkylhydroperoxidase family enzyme